MFYMRIYVMLMLFKPVNSYYKVLIIKSIKLFEYKEN